jgi:hypothetical protein
MTKTLKNKNHLKRKFNDLYRSCAVVVIWLSFWSLIPRDEWWFRVQTSRLQILFVGLLL